MGRGSKGKSKGDSGKQKQQQAKIGVWVWAQCDNDRCQKWRKLPPGTVVDSTEPWFCYMNPNEDRNACELSEESYNEETEAAVYNGGTSDEETSSLHQDPPAWQHNDAQKWSRGQSQANGKAGARATPEPRSASGYLPRKRSSQHHENGFADHRTAAAKRQRTGNGSQAAGAHELAEPSSSEHWGQGLEDAEEAPEAGFSRRQAGAWYPEEASDLGALDARDGGVRGAASQRGIGKARKAHTGFNKLLATGGVWEIVKGKGRAVTALPMWVWEGLTQHAPTAAQLACQAADYSSAARYFEISQARRGPEQAQEAYATARLALTAAAAVAVQSTSQIPGITDSPQSGSGPADAPLAASPQLPAADATSQLQPWPGYSGPLPSLSGSQSMEGLPRGMIPPTGSGASGSLPGTSAPAPAHFPGASQLQSAHFATQPAIGLPGGPAPAVFTQTQLAQLPLHSSAAAGLPPLGMQAAQGNVPAQYPGGQPLQGALGRMPPLTTQPGATQEASVAMSGPVPRSIPDGGSGPAFAHQHRGVPLGQGNAAAGQSLLANGNGGYLLQGQPNGWTQGNTPGLQSLSPQSQAAMPMVGGRNGFTAEQVAAGAKVIAGPAEPLRQPLSSLAGLAQDLAARNSWAPSVSQAGGK